MTSASFHIKPPHAGDDKNASTDATDQPLTRRQSQVLAFVTDRIRLGDPPTDEEISANFGWSSANAAHEHVAALTRKGVLLRASGRSRGLSLPVAAADPLALVRSAILVYHASRPITLFDEKSMCR